MIRIPLCYLHKQGDDCVALLLAPEDRARYETAVAAALKSNLADVRAEAEGIRTALDLDAEAATSDAAVHIVACFKSPSWQDKAAIQGEALRLAGEAGCPQSASLYEVPLRVTRLLERVEDREGKDIETRIPEALYEHLGRRLEAYLYTSRTLTDFFVPAAKSSDASKRETRSRTSKTK